jgi:hypothetical protein
MQRDRDGRQRINSWVNPSVNPLGSSFVNSNLGRNCGLAGSYLQQTKAPFGRLSYCHGGNNYRSLRTTGSAQRRRETSGDQAARPKHAGTATLAPPCRCGGATGQVSRRPVPIRLWEISENLHRADLTEAQRRQHIDEWVRLTAEKVSHCGTPLPGGAQPSEKAIRKASAELNIPKSTVARAVAAESLPPAVKAAADEAGLGTVKRAKLASEPSAEAQRCHLRRRQHLADFIAGFFIGGDFP